MSRVVTEIDNAKLLNGRNASTTVPFPDPEGPDIIKSNPSLIFSRLIVCLDVSVQTHSCYLFFKTSISSSSFFILSSARFNATIATLISRANPAPISAALVAIE